MNICTDCQHSAPHLTEVEAAESLARQTSAAAKELRARFQLGCKHARTIGAPAYRGRASTLPPFRVCRDCGFGEEGWGCGHKILKAEPERSAPREAVRRLVVGAVHGNSLFVGYAPDVRAAGGQAAYVRAQLEKALGLA